jgi:hypothetical protein
MAVARSGSLVGPHAARLEVVLGDKRLHEHASVGFATSDPALKSFATM